jgi:hypothetical protein
MYDGNRCSSPFSNLCSRFFRHEARSRPIDGKKNFPQKFPVTQGISILSSFYLNQKQETLNPFAIHEVLIGLSPQSR